MKSINYRLEKKLNEIFLVEPNNLGHPWLTNRYKQLVSYLKTLPLLVIIPFSFLLSLFLYLILKRIIVELVSLLQYGF